MPTSTVITSAFLNHAVRAAENLRIPDLPLLVPPHPLYDLSPEQIGEVARLSYPSIISQLTSSGEVARITRVNYMRPPSAGAERDGSEQ